MKDDKVNSFLLGKGIEIKNKIAKDYYKDVLRALNLKFVKGKIEDIFPESSSIVLEALAERERVLGEPVDAALYYLKDARRFFIVVFDSSCVAPIMGYDCVLNVRQLFSVMHELGHYLNEFWEDALQGIYPKESGPLTFRDGNSQTGEDPKEVWANNFAAEHLVPISILRQIMEEYCIKDSSDPRLKTLADYFGVSVAVITIRVNKASRSI